ncbi:hypothetical protein GGR56DRAFT_651629 [Xylariaceae sp. FL0804]|nr:hypothetical protein GGR56DRAFT_651629 [Xylariaceae sp. FL0804]
MGRKRTRMDDGHAARPPPNARRTKGATASRPSSLTEVRKSLSSLLEEPNASVGSSVIPASEVGSDGEDDEHSHIHNKENRRSTTVPVVDRIALKRNASSLLSNSGTGASASTSRLAFAAPSSSLASGSGSFKVPALLRRATANSLASSASASSSSLSTTARPPTTLNKAASFSEEGGKVLKLKSAGRRSGINHLAREGERRAKVAEAERRREERKFKGAEGRGRLVGGLFGAGRFE